MMLAMETFRNVVSLPLEIISVTGPLEDIAFALCSISVISIVSLVLVMTARYMYLRRPWRTRTAGVTWQWPGNEDEDFTRSRTVHIVIRVDHWRYYLAYLW